MVKRRKFCSKQLAAACLAAVLCITNVGDSVALAASSGIEASVGSGREADASVQNEETASNDAAREKDGSEDTAGNGSGDSADDDTSGNSTDDEGSAEEGAGDSADSESGAGEDTADSADDESGAGEDTADSTDDDTDPSDNPDNAEGDTDNSGSEETDENGITAGKPGSSTGTDGTVDDTSETEPENKQQGEQPAGELSAEELPAGEEPPVEEPVIEEQTEARSPESIKKEVNRLLKAGSYVESQAFAVIYRASDAEDLINSISETEEDHTERREKSVSEDTDEKESLLEKKEKEETEPDSEEETKEEKEETETISEEETKEEKEETETISEEETKEEKGETETISEEEKKEEKEEVEEEETEEVDKTESEVREKTEEETETSDEMEKVSEKEKKEEKEETEETDEEKSETQEGTKDETERDFGDLDEETKAEEEKELKEYFKEDINVDHIEILMNTGSEVVEYLGFTGIGEEDEADGNSEESDEEDESSVWALRDEEEDSESDGEGPNGSSEEEELDHINEAVEEAIASLPEEENQDLNIVFIEKKGMSTRQLLTKLLSDPRVVTAEPNYIYSLDEYEFDSDAEEEAEESAGIDEHTEEAVPEETGGTAGKTALYSVNDSYANKISDMTSFQWGFDHGGNSEKFMSMYYGAWVHEGSDVNIPDWNNIEKNNASGYVAVMDTGIDFTNPDLKDVMADLVTDLGQSTITSIGGGAHGINTVPGEGQKPADVTDNNSHGTHVAGIIAAEWNGYGVSGAANGVKLIAVKACDTGGFSTKAVLDGINYLIKLQEVLPSDKKIRALNCSFGSGTLSAIQALAMYNLGKTGVVICQSSGNDGENVDKIARSSSINNRNPYVVVVDNIDIQGKRTKSSNYGYTTDLFSPGRDILSTVPWNYSGLCYLPEADNSPMAYDTFASDVAYSSSKYTGTRVYTEPFSKITKIGSIDQKKGFDNFGGAIRVSLSELEEKDNSLMLYLAIPIENGEQPKYISFRNSRSFTTKQYRGTVNVGLKDANSGKNTLYWSMDETLKDLVSIDTEELIEKSNARYKKNYELKTNAGFLYLRIKIKPVGNRNPSKNDIIYIDNIGAGDMLAPYAYKTGTSMATPTVTGSAAVMYKRMEGNGALEGLDNAGKAAAVAAALKSSIQVPAAGKKKNPDKEAKLWKMCSSGGQLDMSQGIAMTPVMESAVVTATPEAGNASSKYTVTIYGRNFGTTPELYVTSAASNPQEDDQIELSLDNNSGETIMSFDATALIQNEKIIPGLTEFTVYASNGMMSCNVLELKFDGALGIYETEYSIPFRSLYKDGKVYDSENDMWSATDEVVMTDCGTAVYMLSKNQVDDHGNTESGYKHFWKIEDANGTNKVIPINSCPQASDQNGSKYLETVSMASIGNEIYAYGFLKSESTNMGSYQLFRYDATNGWVKLKSKIGTANINYPRGASIAAVGDKLYFIGGFTLKKKDGKTVRSYPVNNVYAMSFTNGQPSSFELVGSVPAGGDSKTGFDTPKVASDKNTKNIYVTWGNYKKYDSAGQATSYVDRYIHKLQIGDDGSIKNNEKNGSLNNYFTNNSTMSFGLAAAGGNLYIAGCNGLRGDEDFPSCDTYEIPASSFSSAEMKSYKKRASGATVFKPAAAATASRLYVFGATYFEQGTGNEPEEKVLFLRSTDLTSSRLLNMWVGDEEEELYGVIPDPNSITVHFEANGGLLKIISEEGAEEFAEGITVYYEKGSQLGTLPVPQGPKGWKNTPEELQNVEFAGWWTESGVPLTDPETGYTYDDDTVDDDDDTAADDEAWGNRITETTIADTDLEDGATVYARWQQNGKDISIATYTVQHFVEKPGAYAFFYDDSDLDDEDPDYDALLEILGEDDPDESEYYEQLLDDFDLADTEIIFGKPGEKTRASAYLMEEGKKCSYGFYTPFMEVDEPYTEDGETEPQIIESDQQEIEADGSTYIAVFYLREYYLVIYDLNDGTEDYYYDFVEYEDTVYEPEEEEEPVRDGYRFAGWYLDPEGTEPYDFDEKVSDDVYLYAKWEENGGEPTPPSPQPESSGGRRWNSRRDDARKIVNPNTTYPSYVERTGSWEQAADGSWRYRYTPNSSINAGIAGQQNTAIQQNNAGQQNTAVQQDNAGGQDAALLQRYATGWLAIPDATWKENAAAGSFSWFMFDANGRMLTGWYQDTDGKWYYLNTVPGTGIGAMLTGWHVIDGKRYYFCEAAAGTRVKGELVSGK